MPTYIKHASFEEYIMLDGFLSIYGLCLLGVAVLCFDLLETGVRARGLLPKTRGILYVLALVLGVVCARGFYMLTSPYGGMTELYFSIWPYEYAVSGAVLGVILAGLVTALITRQSAGYVLDAMTPTALVALALSRCAEMFSDFGWGAVVEGRWARFPFAVQDAFEQWRLSIFFLEALLALIVLVYAKAWRRKLPGEMFSIALDWWAMGHLFLETLRAESICWGFVRVQQLFCAAIGLGLLIGWGVKNRIGSKRIRNSLIVYFLCIGVIVFAQFAMDKLTEFIPVIGSYALMAAMLVIMGAVVQSVVCAGKQKLLIKVRYKREEQ